MTPIRSAPVLITKRGKGGSRRGGGGHHRGGHHRGGHHRGGHHHGRYFAHLGFGFGFGLHLGLSYGYWFNPWYDSYYYGHSYYYHPLSYYFGSQYYPIYGPYYSGFSWGPYWHSYDVNPAACYAPSWWSSPAYPAFDPNPPKESEAPDSASAAERYRASSPAALAGYYSDLGDLYMKTRRYARAVDAYQRASKLVEADGSLRFVLADALFQVGRIDEAAFNIRQGLRLNPELATARVDKREFYDWPVDFEKELDSLKKRVSEHPFESNARLVLAYSYRFSGRLDAANKEFTTLLEQMPGDAAVTALRDGLAEILKLDAAQEPVDKEIGDKEPPKKSSVEKIKEV